ncbi:MAG: ABC transporter ATP-binding protein [Phycisphaeraceae bacterium]|nr:ABC transporter ATP-binding protein [Phycisphaeraceae bacterium]
MVFALESVTRCFPHRRQPAVDEVTWSIERGERVALMGVSGSGKSTMLKILAGLDAPDRGRVMIDGREATALEPPERGVGMVLQEAPLHEHLTVAENIAHPLRIRGAERRDARRHADAMLERMRLGALGSSRASELSGGERRRAALARALIIRPALLLLDEPFASLDPVLQADLRDEVRTLCDDFRCACVHATHNGLEALALGTRVSVLHRGRLVDDGPPERIWAKPASRRSAVLLGALPMNLLPLPDTATDGCTHLGIRPEHLRLRAGTGDSRDSASTASAAPPTSRPQAWRAEGVIMAHASTGDQSLVTVRLRGGEVMRVLLPALERSPPTGAAVMLEANSSDLHHFRDSPQQEIV